MNLDRKEEQLEERRARLARMEKEILAKEKELKQREQKKKQLVLRLPNSLWEDVAIWADEDLRSINAQIEYILRQAVQNRKKK